MPSHSPFPLLLMLLLGANSQSPLSQEEPSPGGSGLELDYETVARLASLPLHCYDVEYPYKLGQVLNDESDLKAPKDLHPIFYGCFDWHSSVHGHWLLARAAALYPNTSLAENVTRLFDEQFTKEKVEAEVAYFHRKFGDHFERTYGWAWLLALHQQLEKSALETGSGWAAILSPLSSHISGLLKSFLPRLVYPIRMGEHPNTAFGLSFSLDYTRADGVTEEELEALLVKNSSDFFIGDRKCPLSYEPGGSDFLSPCLQEADLMAKVLQNKEEYRLWLLDFLPQLFDPEFVLEPGVVVDRTDGKLVHLDGLNFSRAWSLYRIGGRLGGEFGARLLNMGDNHVNTSIDYVIGSDYVGSHWLASFLLYALEQRAETIKVLGSDRLTREKE